MKLRPHAGLTTVLRRLLQASIPVATLVLVFNVCGSYKPIPDGMAVALGWARGILMFATGITLLVWIYRTNKNLGALSGEWMQFTPGWSVGWFFVPIACIWKPYQVMKELWHVSHRDAEMSHKVINWWWACWLLPEVVSQDAILIAQSRSYDWQYNLAVLIYAGSDAINLAFIVLTLTIVTRIGVAYARNIVEPSAPAYEEPASPVPTSLA